MHEFELGPGATVGIVAVATVTWFLDFCCLLCAFGAVHAPVPHDGVLLAYGVAQIVAVLPIVPGGLGLVEGSLAVILVAYGAHRVPALSTVLVYRFISYWLAVVVGWTTLRCDHVRDASNERRTSSDVRGAGSFRWRHHAASQRRLLRFSLNPTVFVRAEPAGRYARHPLRFQTYACSNLIGIVRADSVELDDSSAFWPRQGARLIVMAEPSLLLPSMTGDSGPRARATPPTRVRGSSCAGSRSDSVLKRPLATWISRSSAVSSSRCWDHRVRERRRCCDSIAGFEVPDAGTISLRGVDVTGTPPYQRGVNTVFQDYALFPHFDVAQNVAYGLRVKHVKRTEIDERVKAALEMVQMTEFAERRPAQLSGGQRQRVALARAIINEPQVLLLDEPLGALDLKLRQEMQVELKRIQRQIGITFIYVTHDQEEALTMSDRLAVFRSGRIEQIGPPSEVYERPATEFVASFVGTSNVIETPNGRAVLRPEKIEITSGSFADGRTSVAGTVIDVAYLGMVTRFSVRLDDGSTMTVARQNSATGSQKNDLTPESRVLLSWDLNDAFPLTSHSVAETQLGA